MTTSPIHRWPPLLSVTLAAAALLSACGCRHKPDEAPEVVVAVQTAHPTVGPIAEQIAADAILAPIAVAAISPRINAPIREEYVQRGAHVVRGQVLVSLDDRDLRGSAMDGAGAVRSAEANLAATTHSLIPEELSKARSDVVQSQAALEVATRAAEERRRLYLQGALSGREADAAAAAEIQARATFETARQHAAVLDQSTRLTDQQAAQGQLASARGKLLSAQAQISFSTLRSPINGVVTDRPLFPGETAAAGTPVITIMDTSSLLARLHLAQASAQKLALGHPAKVSVPGLDEPVDATVSFISPALDPGSTTVEVWLKLPNADGRFKVGTPVHAIIEGAMLPNAMQVPTSAIVPAEVGQTEVVVVAADGKTRRQPVTVGIRTAASVQILSGISQRDSVVTAGGYGLEDGTRVDANAASPAVEDEP